MAVKRVSVSPVQVVVVLVCLLIAARTCVQTHAGTKQPCGEELLSCSMFEVATVAMVIWPVALHLHLTPVNFQTLF